MTGFAVWLTGLPASGKSSITTELVELLASREIDPEVLESDALRSFLTPEPRFDDAERELFYRSIIFTSSRLVARGTQVLIDATAHRRHWRALAKREIPRLLEVWVDTPLSLCRERDPKGLYRKSERGGTLPGVGVPYETPLTPDVRIDGASSSPLESAKVIVAALTERGWL